MAEFETLAQQKGLLMTWKSHLPPRVLSAVSNAEPIVDFGERYGTWFLKIVWTQGELSRSAELGLTNPETTPDEVTGVAVVSVRSSASSAARYVVETLYERRRAIRRMTSQQLEEWLISAAQRATGYSEASLSQAYTTGTTAFQL